MDKSTGNLNLASSSNTARRTAVANKRRSMMTNKATDLDADSVDLEGLPIEKIPHHRLEKLEDFDSLYETKCLLGKYCDF